jgi:hypothetical protein
MKKQINNLESAIKELRKENRSIAGHRQQFSDAAIAPPTGTDEGDGTGQ